MHAAQASANDSRILSGKLLTETNKAATAKMLPTTTKKTGLLLRYRQAITTRNAATITSALICGFAEPWQLIGDKHIIRRHSWLAMRMANYIDALFNAELNHHWYLINAVTVHVDFQVSDYATQYKRAPLLE
jgi:hypothetical protein